MVETVRIGQETLYLGDCREILPALAPASVEMIFTDPPYGHSNNNGDLIERWEAALGRPSKKPPEAACGEADRQRRR